MGLESTESAGTEEHDVDAILAKAYGGHQNPSEEASKPAVETRAAEPPAPQVREFEFNSRGQPIRVKETDPRFQQWLSQGHDYAQNMNAFKTERQSWEQQRSQFDQQRSQFEKEYSPYREIDAFAKQNPEWWSHVDQSYKQQLSSQQGVPDSVKSYFDSQLAPLKDDIPLMKQFLQEMQTQKMEKQQSEEDARLGQAVKSIQEKYSNLDFSAKDESGLSLEHRVLNHAVQNGFPSFKSAFLDYYHDHLEKQAEARGRESIAQEMAKRKKMGLLDESPAPGRSNAPLFNDAKPRSWHDLRSEDILKEFKFA